MFKIIFSFFLLLSTVCSYSQGGFKKTYALPVNGTNKHNTAEKAFEAPNGNLIEIGLAYNPYDGATFKALTVVGTDAQGNQAWIKTYSSPQYFYLKSHYYHYTAVAKDQNAFYVSVALKDASPTNTIGYGALMKFDYNGDTLWQKTFHGTQNSNLFFTSIVKTYDGGLLMTAINEYNVITLKTDINGNELWRKVLVPSANPGYMPLYGCKVVQDSLTKKLIVLNSDNSKVIVGDSLGNLFSQFTFTTAYGHSFSDMIQVKDKNFIVVGGDNYPVYSHQANGMVPAYKPFILKFDIAGDRLWSRTYGTACIYYNEVKTICEKANGQLFAAIDKYCYDKPYDDLSDNRIMKLDAAGNVVCERNLSRIAPVQRRESINSISMLQNGGIVMAKYSEYFSGMPPGQFRLTTLDSFCCDTLAAWCAIDAVGLRGLSDLTGKAFSVFPNPADNIVNVKIDSPFEAAYKIKISDIGGRELELLSLKEDMQLQLSTENYKSGIYFISVLYDHKSIETKKLVIIK